MDPTRRKTQTEYYLSLPSKSLRPPENDDLFPWPDLLLGAVLGLAALVLFSLNWPFAYADTWFTPLGGESTVGAWRVLKGEIPYRDFWTLYAPGHFYLLAVIFLLFGVSLKVEVVAASVFCAAAVSVFYFLIRGVLNRRGPAVLAACALVAALFNSDYYYFRFETYPPTLLFVLLSFLCLTLHFRRRRIHFVALAGVFAGLATLMKHDVGAYTAIASLAGMAVDCFLAPSKGSKPWLTGFLRTAVVYCEYVLVVTLPVAVYFAATAGRDLFQNIVVFPLTDWKWSRPEHYPSLLPRGLFTGQPLEIVDRLCEYIKFTLPLALNLAGLFGIAAAIRRGQRTLAAGAVILWIAFWFHYAGAHLQVNTHIVTMACYGAASGAVLYAALSTGVSERRAKAVSAGALALAALWCAALLARPLYKVAHRRNLPAVALQLPRVSGFHVPKEHAQSLAALVQFVETNIPRSEYLYIGLNRHDAMAANDLLAYFILDRPVPVRYHDLHPAVADRPAAQQEMIADLDARRPPYVILRRFFSDAELDRMKAEFEVHLPGVGATHLDRYLSENYSLTAQFPPYSVYARRDGRAGQ